MPAAHQAHIVLDADGVALRPASLRELGGIPTLGVAALRTRTVHIHPGAVHVAQRAAKGHVIGGLALARRTGVRGTAPVKWIIFLTGLVAQAGALKKRVNRRRSAGIRRAAVIHDALQLLDIRQTPVIVTEIIGGVLGLHPAERLLPVHGTAAVGFGPGQAGGGVADGLVAVILKSVLPILGIPPHANHKEGLFRAAGHAQVIALDAPIGKIDAEQLLAAARGRADVDRAGSVLRVDRALAGLGIAVDKLEVGGVDKGDQLHRAAADARIGAAEVDQRIEFLDRRQPPVRIPAEIGGVQLGGQGLRLRQGQLVAFVERAIAVGFRAALPGQASHQVIDGQAVGAQAVAGRMAGILGILPEETGLRTGHFDAVIVALALPRIHNWIGQVRGGLRGAGLLGWGGLAGWQAGGRTGDDESRRGCGLADGGCRRCARAGGQQQCGADEYINGFFHAHVVLLG